MKIEQFTESDREDILRLLEEANLPFEDLTLEKLKNFLVAREKNGVTVGAVGVELYQDVGLLRSLVVHPLHRGRGLGKWLTDEIEAYASERGIKTLYLLTMTAADFFLHRGYQVTQRSEAPQPIADTFEFKSASPISAVCLHKHLK